MIGLLMALTLLHANAPNVCLTSEMCNVMIEEQSNFVVEYDLTPLPDVPAVHKKVCHRLPTTPTCCWRSGDLYGCHYPALEEECKANGGQFIFYDEQCEEVYTCDDKERILMISESGKHWCHAVQPAMLGP